MNKKMMWIIIGIMVVAGFFYFQKHADTWYLADTYAQYLTLRQNLINQGNPCVGPAAQLTTTMMNCLAQYDFTYDPQSFYLNKYSFISSNNETCNVAFTKGYNSGATNGASYYISLAKCASDYRALYTGGINCTSPAAENGVHQCRFSDVYNCANGVWRQEHSCGESCKRSIPRWKLADATADCTLGSGCDTPADTNCDNCVSRTEFSAYASRWINNQGLSFADMMTAAGRWVNRNHGIC